MVPESNASEGGKKIQDGCCSSLTLSLILVQRYSGKAKSMNAAKFERACTRDESARSNSDGKFALPVRPALVV
jgi:hypothetical protein